MMYIKRNQSTLEDLLCDILFAVLDNMASQVLNIPGMTLLTSIP